MSDTPYSEHHLLLIEKVLLLKSLSIFAETPETILVEVAELLREEEVPAGTRLFGAGDIGDCLYVIYNGEVRIHNGEMTLAVLKDRDFFGELSLLDAETRSAGATVTADALLLKLNQEPFYELMESRIEVAKGIIRMLCKRQREDNLKLYAGGDADRG